MIDIPYKRYDALRYAKKWAYSRNPMYYDFGEIGGDCTNFISQCLYAGVGVMNYTPIYGWYYRSVNDRSPSWTGVNYLSSFLLSNKTIGPYGSITDSKKIEPGDIIQLGNKDGNFYHSLIATEVNPEILVATHSFNAFNRPLSSYDYESIQFIHIDGARSYF